MAQTKVSVVMFLILNLLFSTVTADYGNGGGGGGGGGSGVGIPGLPIGTTPTPILPVPSPSTPSPSLPIGTTPTPTLPLPSPGTPIPGLPIGTTPTPTLPLPSPATPSLPTTPVGLPSTPVGGLPTTPVGGLPSVPVGGLPTLPNPGGLLGGLTCPINVLKLSVCANVLGGLLHVNVGLGGVLGGLLGGGNQRCCSLVAGLVDLDAAVCLCTAIRANVLGINLNVPLSLNLLLNDCGKNLPSGFLCPAV